LPGQGPRVASAARIETEACGFRKPSATVKQL
jgi:hypothetical protein